MGTQKFSALSALNKSGIFIVVSLFMLLLCSLILASVPNLWADGPTPGNSSNPTPPSQTDQQKEAFQKAVDEAAAKKKEEEDKKLYRSVTSVSVHCRNSKFEIAGNLPCDDQELDETAKKKLARLPKPDTRTPASNSNQSVTVAPGLTRKQQFDALLNGLGSSSGTNDPAANKLSGDLQAQIKDPGCDFSDINDASNQKKGGASPNDALGKRPGFKSVVKCHVREDLRIEADKYYHGEGKSWFTGKKIKQENATPVCNINFTAGKNKDGERTNNWLSEPSLNNCASMCQLEVDSFSGDPVSVKNPAGCIAEQSWYRGAYIQALNKYKEDVLAEFNDGKVSVTDFDGPKPCSQLAYQLNDIQQADDPLVQQFLVFLSSKHPIPEGSKLEVIEQIASQDFCADPSITDPSAEITSTALCQMEFAQKEIQAMWKYFLACEIHARAMKNYLIVLNRLGEVQDQVSSTCKNKICDLCEDDEKSDDATTCYQKNMPPFLQKLLQRAFPTKEKLELPLEAFGQQS